MIVWLTETEARKFIGRGKVTLWKWRKRGIVQARRLRDGSWQYGRGSLLLARKDSERRAQASQVHNRNRRVSEIGSPGANYRGRPGVNPGQLELFVLGG